ncbi:MAG TPA: hypothetical protein VHD56_18625 [Tepidisphaeraceae bacterium]|nr:hypothetical protein [Tepidisphaeraceae bacterium]
MFRKNAKAIVAAACASPLFSAVAMAGTLYDSTTALRFDLQTDPIPAYFKADNNTHILFDDVPINVGATVTPFVHVDRLTFEITRLNGAAPASVNVYWANMVPDNSTNRGGSDPSLSPYDDFTDDTGPAHLIGVLDLPGNTSGSPVHGTFSIDTDFFTDVLDTTTADYDPVNDQYNLGAHPGYGYFFIGLQFPTATAENGWSLATDPNNLGDITVDFQDTDPTTVDQFFPGFDSADNPFFGTMALKVEGTLLPEPASLSLLALPAISLLSRRKRV